MTMYSVDGSADRTTALIDNWRRASLARSWGYPSDWDCAEAWLFAGSIGASNDRLISAAKVFATARAMQGVGIGEALDDLSALFQSTLGMAIPPAVTRAFAESWTEEWQAVERERLTTDAATGLHTRGFFQERLQEIVLEAELPDSGHREPRILIVIDARTIRRSTGPLGPVSALIGQIIDTIFSEGETAAAFHPDRFALLAYADSDSTRKIEDLTTRLSALAVTLSGDAARAPVVQVLPLGTGVTEQLRLIDAFFTRAR